MDKTSNRRERTHERAQESEIPQICSHILRSLIKSYTHMHTYIYTYTHTQRQRVISVHAVCWPLQYSPSPLVLTMFLPSFLQYFLSSEWRNLVETSELYLYVTWSHSLQNI